MDLRSSSIGVLIFIGFLIFLTFSSNNKTEPVPQVNYETLKIANWNMQIFGSSKANDANLMNSYVDKIKNYDIIFLQEIKDDSGSAARTLCGMLLDYNCRLSSRAGSTSSKEQYLVVYKKNIDIVNYVDYNLLNYTEQFERPPVEVTFAVNYTNFVNYTYSQTNYFNITIWNIHIKPDSVETELTNLQSLIIYKPSTIVLGDMNADCDYFHPINTTLFRGWKWIIQNGEDTTVANTHCAYDRIWMDDETFLRVSNSGIDSQVTSEQSDHYIVWVELNKDLNL